MTDTFEVKGKWFLPEADSEQAVSGILRYSPNRITLDLIGAFDVDVTDDKRFSLITIYGNSESGEYITLSKAIPSCGNIILNTVSSFVIDRFFVGDRFIKNQEECLFNGVSFSFTNLNAWFDFPIVKHRSELENQVECFIDFKDPLCNMLSFDIPSANLTLSEVVDYNFINPKDFYTYEEHGIAIKRFYQLDPLSRNLFSANQMRYYAQQICNLLTVIVDNAMYFLYLDLKLPNNKTSNFCRMFFRQRGDILKAKHLTRNDPSILIKRCDIKDTMSDIFDYWFQEQEKLGECINAYISDRYLPTYMENEFLSVVRGIESYHRFFVGEQSNKQKKMSLRKRLDSVFSSIPDRLLKYLFGEFTSKEEGVVKTIVDTRNYYTHRDDKRNHDNRVQSHSQLLDLTDQLAVLLQYLCLKQIGVNPDIIVQRLISRL